MTRLFAAALAALWLFAAAPSFAASPVLNPTTGTGGVATGANITSPNLTTTATNCVVFAIVFANNATTVSTVKSVTGGQSFTKLAGFDSTPALIEVWFLESSAVFNDTIEATLTGTSGITNLAIGVFGVHGVANLSSPFDPNGVLPVTGNGTATTASVTYSTTNADDLLLWVAVNGSTSSGATGQPATPTGFTNIIGAPSNNGGGSIFATLAFQSLSSAQSSVAISSTVASVVGNWAVIAFAVTADGSVTVIPLPAFFPFAF